MRFVLILALAACGTGGKEPDYGFQPPEDEDLYGVWDENVSDDDVAEIEFSEPDVYVKRTGHENTELERGQFELLPHHSFSVGVFPGLQLTPTTAGFDAQLRAITDYDGTMIYFDGRDDYTYSRR
jgi:hypothetical protein